MMMMPDQKIVWTERSISCEDDFGTGGNKITISINTQQFSFFPWKNSVEFFSRLSCVGIFDGVSLSILDIFT